MFRLVVALLLGLTVGWKVALSLTNNREERDDVKSALVEFLVRQHFAVFEANDINGVEATADGCRLRITGTQVWNQDIIKDVASADDHVFFVYRQTVYTNLPTWSIITNQYWSRFLGKIEFRHLGDSPIIAVIASAHCNAERLPWHEFLPSA
jgi:hypothetical protein